jgi:hypothetical protein
VIKVTTNKGIPSVKLGKEYVPMHMIIAKTLLKLKDGDSVAWKDGNRQNYAPENLQISENLNSAHIKWEEIQDSKIEINCPFSFRHIADAAFENNMETREKLVQAIKDVRRVFAAINSTPKTYIFKDFEDGNPKLVVGNHSDLGTKLGLVDLSTDLTYKTVLDLFKKHARLFTYDDIRFFTTNPTSYTFFRGYKIEPAETFNQGIIDPFLGFVHEVICDSDDEMFYYILNWYATIVRYPNIKQETTLVILGDIRTGKTTFTNILSHLLDQYAVPNITDIDHIIGKFNAVFENKRLVVCNELQTVAENKRVNFERLKTIISDKTVSFNKKYGKMGQADNVAHFIFVSNNVVPIKIEKHDARFFVTKVSNNYQNNHDYFKDLESILTDEFYQQLMRFFLIELNLDDFEHRKIPHTQVKQDIIDACEDPKEKFVRQCFRLIHNITGSNLFKLFKTFCKDENYSITGYTKTLFLAEMRRYIGLPKTKMIAGQRQEVYNLRAEILAELAEIFLREQQQEEQQQEEQHE